MTCSTEFLLSNSNLFPVVKSCTCSCTVSVTQSINVLRLIV